MAKKFEEIKEEEYPYELPEGWKWERLGKCVNLSANKTELFLDSTKYVGLENIEKDTGIIKYEIGAELKSIKNVFVEGQILYGKLRPYLNKHGIAKFKGVCSTDILVFSANNDVSNKWVDYYFNMPSFISYAISNSTGINLPRVNSKSILSYVIPIPPKETQQKIVDIIESLFAKLDIAQEKVEHVLAESENRRSAILHNAFSGKLTEKWREENKNIVIEDIDLSLIDKNYDVQELEYDLPSTWKWVTFNEICTFIGSGVTPKGGQEVYTLNGIPFIRSQNVLRLKLDLSDVAYISDEINSKMKRTQIKGGETLFNITGASIGRACYVHRKQNTGNVNQHVCILRYKNFILENLPQYWLNSSMMQYFISDNQIGQTRQALNFKQIRGIMFPLCPYEEQKEIVRLLDKFLSVEDKVKSTCQSTLEAIATMRKSILAKAFRGELVS